jgi:SAM-dependent methyltransferase
MGSKVINQKYYDRYWNDNMIKYLSNSAGVRWFDHLFYAALDAIPKKSIHTVADIGCGLGLKSATMAKYFPKAKVYGYDFSKPGINAAKREFKDTKNLYFDTKDITLQKNNQNKYDLITAFDLLEHIDDWQKLAKELIAVNNKYMLISSPVGRMRPYEVHIGHFRNFKVGEIESFMEDHGYKTVKTFYAGFPFHSPILRNLTDRFYKEYADLPQSEMTFSSKRMHDIWYLLFRYGSMKQKGDIFVGLFEKM